MRSTSSFNALPDIFVGMNCPVLGDRSGAVSGPHRSGAGAKKLRCLELEPEM